MLYITDGFTFECFTFAKISSVIISYTSKNDLQLSRSFICISPFILRRILQCRKGSGHCYFHTTDKELEIQRQSLLSSSILNSSP